MDRARFPLAAVFSVTCIIAAMSVEVQAQCVSCGNPAFASGDNDISRRLATASNTNLITLRTGLVYGYGTANSYFEGDEKTVNFDNFDMTMNLFTLIANIEGPTGTEIATVLPFGQLASTRRFHEDGSDDRGLGDFEIRLRQELAGLFKLTGAKMPRIVLSLGVAAPTGVYLAKEPESAGDIFADNLGGGFGGGGFAGETDDSDTMSSGVDSSKYLSIGRGAWWMLADLEVMGRATDKIGYYTGLSVRRSLSDAPDGFRWGDEARVAAGASAAVVRRWLNVGVQAEYQWRGGSSEILQDQRQDFPNGGGNWLNLMPTVQSQVLEQLSVSLSMRYPLYRDVVGIQVVENTSVWLSVAGNFGIGSTNSGKNPTAKASPRGIGPGDAPDTEEIRALLVAGKVTIVDYWASWCKPCQKLSKVVTKWKQSKPDHVVLRKFDASEWEPKHWAKFLPNAPTLPVMDIYGRDGRLVARLSGDEAFRFTDHLPK